MEFSIHKEAAKQTERAPVFANAFQKNKQKQSEVEPNQPAS
jgi:hypothetical protein